MDNGGESPVSVSLYIPILTTLETDFFTLSIFMRMSLKKFWKNLRKQRKNGMNCKLPQT